MAPTPSWAVGAQALLLILIIPIYGAVTRHVDASRLYQRINAFFVLNLLVFYVLGQAGWQFGFAFFVWASLFGVMAVTQFWAFATDLCSVESGQRLFGVFAVGAAGGAWFGARAFASALFEPLGAYGLMLAAAGAITAAILLSRRARAAMPRGRAEFTDLPEVDTARPQRPRRPVARRFPADRPQRLPGRHRDAGRAAQLDQFDRRLRPVRLADRSRGPRSAGQPAAYIGRFMGEFCSSITLIAFLVQLLLVSRIIQLAGLARALMVTPIAFIAGYLLVGIVPMFLLLQSALVVNKSFDYSLLNTTRNALLLPTSREVKYQAKTAIDTFFYRLGDLLSTASVFVGMRLFARTRARSSCG